MWRPARSREPELLLNQSTLQPRTDSSTASQAWEISAMNAPNHTVISIILKDLDLQMKLQNSPKLAKQPSSSTAFKNSKLTNNIIDSKIKSVRIQNKITDPNPLNPFLSNSLMKSIWTNYIEFNIQSTLSTSFEENEITHNFSNMRESFFWI